MTNFLTRTAARLIGKAAPTEGEYRDGPWWLPVTGGWLPQSVGQYWNWWQMGYDPLPPASNAMAEACINAYAKTVAMAPGDHWRLQDNGGRERVTTSAACRILRRPNDYQSISDFLFNLTRQLYLNGNAYALAIRNDRFEVAELHLMHSRSSGVSIASTGDVFYYLGGNEVIEARLGEQRAMLAHIPARDVLHIRLNTPRNPLIGESPLLAAMSDIAAAGAMTTQQIAFYTNQARPATVLSTDEKLTREQIGQFRELYNEQAKGLAAGGTVILAGGMKPHPLGGTADDAQFVQALDATDRHIALALGVPLQVLGVGKSAPYSSVEVLMQSWLAGGLGFILSHIELGFDRLFGLKGQPDEYVELDTGVLLRSATKERMDAHAVAVRAGVKTVNEVRAEEQLPEKEFGDEVRVQQQEVPLSFWHDQQQQAAKPPKLPPQAPAAPPALPPPQEKPNAQRSSADWARALLDAADTCDRAA